MDNSNYNNVHSSGTNEINTFMTLENTDGDLGSALKKHLINELKSDTTDVHAKYESCLKTIDDELTKNQVNEKTKDKFAAKVIKQVFTIYLSLRENYLTLPDNLVTVLGKLFKVASPKTLKKVANRKVWRFLEKLIKYGCNTTLIEILDPALCLIDKLPRRSKQLQNPLVVFRLQTQRLRPILDTGIELENVDSLLTECKHLNDLFNYHFPTWLGLSKTCRHMRTTSDCSALKEFCQLLKQLKTSQIEILEFSSLIIENIFSKMDVDASGARIFLQELLEIQIVGDGEVKFNSSPFKRLVSVLHYTIEFLYFSVSTMTEYGCETCVLGHCKETRFKELNINLELLDHLSHINETWYTLFELPETTSIIDREEFVNFIQSAALCKNVERVKDIEEINFYSSLLGACPMSFYTSLRKKTFHIRLQMERDQSPGGMIFNVSRKNLLDDWKSIIAHNMDLIKYTWYYRFKGEDAHGYGPTKEFYSLLALELQKYCLNLWEGEPVDVNDEAGRGAEDTLKENPIYVHNPHGLFPRLTNVEIDDDEPYYDGDMFTLFGITMAKMLLDGYWLGVPLSVEFFRQYVCQRRDPLCWSIYEVPKVIPQAHKLIQQLVVVKKKKILILQNEALSECEKKEQIENLMFDEGCPFEDLCINFTVPGRPDIAIVDDGQNIYLNSANIEDYLESLAFTVLQGRNVNRIVSFRTGFEEVLSLDHLSVLLPEDMQKIVCGEKFEEWTVQYLLSSSQLEGGLTAESNSVQYLFQVLSSLDEKEQRLFMKFVSGSDGLPFGGLMSLYPPLTVSPVFHSPHEMDKKLPSAATCNNTIFIPSYSSLEVTREKLLLAITECRDCFGFV